MGDDFGMSKNKLIGHDQLYRRLRDNADFSTLIEYLNKFQNAFDPEPDEVFALIAACSEGLPTFECWNVYDELAIFTRYATSFLTDPSGGTSVELLNCWATVSCVVLPDVVTGYAHEPGRMLFILCHAVRNLPSVAIDEFEMFCSWLIKQDIREESNPESMQIVIEVLLGFLRSDESHIYSAIELAESVRKAWGYKNVGEVFNCVAGVESGWWDGIILTADDNVMALPAFVEWRNMIANIEIDD